MNRKYDAVKHRWVEPGPDWKRIGVAATLVTVLGGGGVMAIKNFVIPHFSDSGHSIDVGTVPGCDLDYGLATSTAVPGPTEAPTATVVPMRPVEPTRMPEPTRAVGSPDFPTGVLAEYGKLGFANFEVTAFGGPENRFVVLTADGKPLMVKSPDGRSEDVLERINKAMEEAKKSGKTVGVLSKVVTRELPTEDYDLSGLGQPVRGVTPEQMAAAGITVIDGGGKYKPALTEIGWEALRAIVSPDFNRLYIVSVPGQGIDAMSVGAVADKIGGSVGAKLRKVMADEGVKTLEYKKLSFDGEFDRWHLSAFNEAGKLFDGAVRGEMVKRPSLLSQPSGPVLMRERSPGGTRGGKFTASNFLLIPVPSDRTERVLFSAVGFDVKPDGEIVALPYYDGMGDGYRQWPENLSSQVDAYVVSAVSALGMDAQEGRKSTKLGDFNVKHTSQLVTFQK